MSALYHRQRLLGSWNHVARVAQRTVALRAGNAAAKQATPPPAASLWTSGIPTLEYYVRVGLGTPAQPATLVLDTGSSFLWTTCAGCTACPNASYFIPLHRFNSSQSSTAKRVTCSQNSPFCYDPLCSNPSTKYCYFTIFYGGGGFSSNTRGSIYTDVLSLPSYYNGSATVKGPATFGCATVESDIFLEPCGAIDGIFGLAAAPDAPLFQLQKSGAIPFAFSLCFDGYNPSGSRVVLGRVPEPPRLTSTNITVGFWYYLPVVAMRVASVVMPSSRNVGATYQVIIDSGTSVPFLPDGLYAELVRHAFWKRKVVYVPTYGFNCTYISPSTNKSAINSALASFPNISMDFPTSSWVFPPRQYLYFAQLRAKSGRGFDSYFCFAAVSGTMGAPMILGESWFQDTFVRIDLDKSVLSWTPMNCSTSTYFAAASPPGLRRPPPPPSLPQPYLCPNPPPPAA